MTALTEPKVIGDLIVNEWDDRLSRAPYVFRQSSGSTADFTIGHVCVLSTGKMIPATGSTFSGILLANIDDLATAMDSDQVPFLTQGPAIVNKSRLVFDAGCDSTEQLAIIAAMLLVGIQVVSEPSETTVAD